MTLWQDNAARTHIKLCHLARIASLLLVNLSHSSPLSIIILFLSLPRKVLVWLHPDLLSHVTWSADLSLSLAHKPIKVCECSWRQQDETLKSTCTVSQPSQPTETEDRREPFRVEPLAHIQMLIFPPLIHLQTRFRRLCDYPERHLCQPPQAPLHTNISVVTLAPFTGRKPGRGRKTKSFLVKQ